MASLMRTLLTILMLTATTAISQTPMTAEEFDEYVTGKIIVFGSEGTPDYGVEHYMSNQRVRWSAFNGQCLDGVWYYYPPSICFAYAGVEEHQCWKVYATPDGLEARHSISGQLIFEGREDPSALVCGDLFS